MNFFDYLLKIYANYKVSLALDKLCVIKLAYSSS